MPDPLLVMIINGFLFTIGAVLALVVMVLIAGILVWFEEHT